MKTVFKILAALAALVGIAYVIATYGDKIVAWCKDLLNCCDIDEDDFADSDEAEAEEAVADEEPAEEESVEEVAEEEFVTEEAPAEEIVADEAAPIADEEDFEG